MRTEIYKQLMAMQASRRSMLKGAAALGTSMALGGVPGLATASNGLRADILKIPGVGQGSPGDAEWQKVGEMCLGGTKETVKPGVRQSRRHRLRWPRRHQDRH